MKFTSNAPDCCQAPALNCDSQRVESPGTELAVVHKEHTCGSCGAQWRSYQDQPAGFVNDDPRFAVAGRSPEFRVRVK